LERITNRIIEDAIKGLNGSPPHIPTVSEVLKRVEIEAKTFIPGLPQFKARKIVPRSTSSVAVYNDNLGEIVDDLEIWYDESVGQVTQILRGFNASETEFRKVRRELSSLIGEIDSLLLLKDNTEGYFYTFTDTFNDRAFTDIKRSTAEIDTDEGAVLLPAEGTDLKRISLSFLEDNPDGRFQITQGREVVKTEGEAKESPFMNIFTDILRVWKYQIVASQSTRISGEFKVRLSPDGKDKIVNRISIESHSGQPMVIGIRYRNSVTGTEFKPLPTSNPDRPVNGRETWVIDTDRIERAEGLPTGGIAEIKVILSKDHEDYTENGEFIYEFGIRNLAIYRTKNTSSATHRSLSIPVIDSLGNLLITNQVALEVDEEVLPGTSIAYYLAPDEYVPDGVFMTASGVTSPGDPDIITFASGVPNTNTQTLHSELKDWVDSNTLVDFTFNGVNYWNWEPNWIAITPINSRPTNAVNNAEIGAQIVRFDNLSFVDENGPQNGIVEAGWSNVGGSPFLSTILESANGIGFYKIYTFIDHVPINDTVELRQGRSCWIYTNQPETARRSAEAYVIEGEFFTASGTVVPNSIVDVRPSGAVISEGTVFLGPNDSPLPDYTVQYSDSQFKISAYTQLVERRTMIVDQTLRLSYVYDETINRTRWITHYFLKPNEATILTIVNPALHGVISAKVENLDGLSSFPLATEAFRQLSDGSWQAKLHEIGNGFGWFTITVDAATPEGSLSGVFIPTVEAFFTSSSNAPHYGFLGHLKVVAEHSLKYDTHRDDHTRCSVVTPLSGDPYILVKPPIFDAAPGDFVVFIDGTTTPLISILLIYSFAAYIDRFYDLKYMYASKNVDHLLFKVDLNSRDVSKTPRLRSYTLKVANQVVI